MQDKKKVKVYLESLRLVDMCQKKDFSNMEALLKSAQSVIAKTRQKGTIHKNNMARRIGRLTSFVNKAKAVKAQ